MKRLVDELLSSPVKYAFLLAKESIFANKALFFSLAALVIVLAIVSQLPLLGFFASLLSGALVLALMIVVGKIFMQSEDIEAYVGSIKSLSIGDIFKNGLMSAFGAYLGFAILLIGVGVIFLVVLAPIYSFASANIATLTQKPGAIILVTLILSYLFYLTPLVYSRLIKSSTFSEAFQAVFAYFLPSLVKKAFKAEYFWYMTKLGFALIGLFIFLVLLLMLLTYMAKLLGSALAFLPLGLIVIVASLVQLYFYYLYAIVSIVADRLTDDEDHTL